MHVHATAFAAALAAMLAMTAAAEAQSLATARSDVNMRAGPGTSHARITVIPAGAQVQVFGCGGWCRVAYGGRNGWVAAGYLGRGVATRPVEVPSEISDWTYWDDNDSDWTYYRYPYGYWFTSPGGYWWTSPGVLFRF